MAEARLPAAETRAVRLRAAAACALLAAALAAAVAARPVWLGPFYGLKVLAAFAAVALVVIAGVARYHPFGRFGAANQVTLLRAALAAALAGLVGEGAAPQTIAGLAAVLGGAAVLLDCVDGRLARATGMASAFGARFDMETDAALVLVLAVLAWQLDKAGAWVLASGLARYAFVAASLAAPWMARPLPPRRRRQTVAAVQMVALVVVVAPPTLPAASAVVAALALALLAWSFAVDTLWLFQRREKAR
jgi:phosphatidylglycerophosphate synthase